ncbi:MAG: hypothetical protein HUU35_13785 [Armatimonadetes bacterium]|nr:hypothetical protein [Armatimonadota bacterium]
MGDFFKAGESYRNRLGEYEVVEVRTPTLLIRYVETGRLQEVEEELQERIVRNLMRELEAASQPAEERKSSARGQRPKRKRAKFEGFGSNDFEGTSFTWHNKTALGGVLAQALQDRVGETFESWAPNKSPICYVTSAEEAAQEYEGDSAQFFVQAASTGLSFGLNIHRPADAAEGSTAWDRLITTLGEDEPISAQLNDLLVSGTVELSWYGETWAPSERETVRGEDDGLLLDRGSVTETDSIEAVIERLNEAPQDQGLRLRIESGMSREDAIKAGATVAENICDLLEQLIGLYRACKG